MKITLNIPDNLLQLVDEQAKKLYINRTAYIVTALSQKIQSEQIINKLPELQSAIQDMQNSLDNKNS